jgi:hypothetical protein
VCWWDERTGGPPAGQTKVRTAKLCENIGKLRNVSEIFSEYEKLPKLFVFAKLLTKL